MSDNDLEYTGLGKIHRSMSIDLLAGICAYLYHLKRCTNFGTPTDVWFSEHIHQLVEPRFNKINKEKSTVDVLQLMIDAVYSDDKVSITNLI